MGNIKIRYLIRKSSGWYWQPGKAAKAAGMTGEALGRDLAKAVQRAEYLNAIWDSMRLEMAAPPSRPEGSVSWLVKDYQRSNMYARLAKGTKANVDRYLRVIDDALGVAPVAGIRRKHCRQLHDKLSRLKSETYANNCIKVLRRLLNYGIEIGQSDTNPAAGMGLRHARPRRIVWLREEIEAFKAKAIELGAPSWALAVQIGYDTAQRLGDVLAANWNDFDGEGITFRQRKTGEVVWCPLMFAETWQMLAAAERRSVKIITGDAHGRPITSSGHFARTFKRIREAAGLRPELQFRDLRRTAASEVLGGGGRAEPLTGHRPGSAVIKTYEVPNREGAQTAQDARRRFHERKLEKDDG